MQQPNSAARSRTATALLGVSALILIVLILAYPDEAFQASFGGLRLWWTVLVPGLLPYLVVMELFTGFGLTRAFGALVEPALYRLFRIPRGGGAPVIAGLLGGFPQGIQTARRVLDVTPLDRYAAFRMLAASHLCNPALLVTVVGAGFLQNVRAGVLLALIHYLSAGVAGWLGRFFLPESSVPSRNTGKDEPSKTFYVELREARQEDGRSFGQLLGDAVTSTIQALFTLCGFIILFSVLIRMIALQLPDDGIGRWFLLLPALLEPHLGAYAAAVRLEPSLLQLAVIAAALAWGGISQHVQVKALSGAASPRYGAYAAARLLQSLLAFGLTFALAVPLASWLGGSTETMAVLPAFSQTESFSPRLPSFAGWPHALDSLRLSLAAAGLLLGITALCFRPIHRMKRKKRY
ncbi:hypothetical protein [Gorillibacterium timonense]|uniref:hypothetical protein n=1 Tax=Gorillibacterium timonense TaxID=1689269 RepID=UPI00071E3EAF|nr:hypothetical protein [Gorillibacterium timonense]